MCEGGEWLGVTRGHVRVRHEVGGCERGGVGAVCDMISDDGRTSERCLRYQNCLTIYRLMAQTVLFVPLHIINAGGKELYKVASYTHVYITLRDMTQRHVTQRYVTQCQEYMHAY